MVTRQKYAAVWGVAWILGVEAGGLWAEEGQRGDGGGGDPCELAEGDCNANGVPDACDIARGTSKDVDSNLVPDECQVDCNLNRTPDAHEVATGAVADCDGDGVPDSCQLAPFLPIMDFPHREVTSFGGSADLDGDGAKELVARRGGTEAHHIVVGRHTGGGMFEFHDALQLDAQTKWVDESATRHPSMVFADFNGDRMEDVALLWEAGIAMCLSDGGLGFTQLPVVPLKLSSEFSFGVAADMDGDSDSDLIINAGTLLRNDGSGALADVTSFDTDPPGDGGSCFIGIGFGMAAADVDSDGDADIAMAQACIIDDIEGRSYFVQLFRNDGWGTFSQEVLHREGVPFGQRPDYFDTVVFSDFNNDSAPDILVERPVNSSGLDLYLNDGMGHFDGMPVRLGGGGIVRLGRKSTAAGDFDGDGDVDWVTYDTGGHHDVSLNRISEGGPIWTPGEGLSVRIVSAQVDVGDFNGDGAADVLGLRGGTSFPFLGLSQLPAALNRDKNRNQILDSCEPDCNANATPDDLDMISGASLDCNQNRVPDECETDCDQNGKPDDCDLAADPSFKCPGGLQLPGDASQDGTLDLSDAIWLLGHLFLGTQGALPCDGGNSANPGAGALLLLDSSGDGLLDLSDAVRVLGFLFLGSDPPLLGSGCTRIVGCPDVCRQP
jgi:hypothetical protein